jgi:hypothetical protein
MSLNPIQVTEELKMGDDVIVEWVNQEHNLIRFLYGKIIDIVTENNLIKYKVQYINDLARWETELKVELWDKKNIRKRKT